MQRVQRFKHLPSDWLRALPFMLVLLVLVVASVDLLIAIQPPFLRSLDVVLRRYAAISGVRATWSSMTAAAISLACVALAASLLLTFIRSFQAAPYVGLAPPLIAFSAWVMARIPIALPLHVTPQIFAGFAAFLVFSGGAMLCAAVYRNKVLGAFLLTAPVFLLAISYALTRGHADAARFPLDQHAQLLFLMLTMATIGTALIAIVWPRGLTASAAVGSTQLVELMERARASEERAAEAERRLATLQSDAIMVSTASAEDEDLNALQRKPGQRTLVWGSICLAVAVYFGGIYFGYVPVRRQLLAALEDRRHLAARESAKQTALRNQWAEERTALEQRLVAAELNAPSQESKTVRAVERALPAATPPERSAPTTPKTIHKPISPPAKTSAAATEPDSQKPRPPTPTIKSATPKPSHDDFPVDLTSDDPLEGL
jgi:hypothetical protein